MNIACDKDRIVEEKLYKLLISNLKTDDVNGESFLLDPSNSIPITAFFLREVLKRKLAKKATELNDQQLSYLINGVVNHGSYVTIENAKYVVQVAYFLNRLGIQFPVPDRPIIENNVNIFLKNRDC